MAFTLTIIERHFFFSINIFTGKKKVQFTVYNYGFYSDILYYIAFAAVTAFPGSGQTVDGTSLTVVLVAFFALLSFSFNHVLAHRAYLVRKTGT